MRPRAFDYYPGLAIFAGLSALARPEGLLAALRSGLGFFVLPERVVPSDLKIAREHYLPQLPDLAAGLYLREGLDAKRMAPLIESLDSVLNPDRMPVGAGADDACLPKARKGAA